MSCGGICDIGTDLRDENSVCDSLPRDWTESEREDTKKRVWRRRVTAGTNARKTKENLVRDGKFRRFASLDAFARWRQRRPRFLLDEKRRRGHRSGGATRKKVYRLQRSEKLRFRSQHRRHSFASFSVPLYPLYMHLSATAATGIWGQHVETATAAQFSLILSIIFPSLIFSGRFLFVRYCVLHLFCEVNWLHVIERWPLKIIIRCSNLKLGYYLFYTLYWFIKAWWFFWTLETHLFYLYYFYRSICSM